MSFTKTYFLCPTSDFFPPPPAGPLRLGSIIRSTSTPQSPLNATSAVPVPNENPPVTETNWRKTVSSETGLGAGVYAQFLHMDAGPGADAERSCRTASAFAFDAVTTTSFEPTAEYVEEAVRRAEGVRAWRKEPRQRFASVAGAATSPFSSSLYMVTGLKVVRGARVRYSTRRKTNMAVNGAVDLAPPFGVGFGPRGEWRAVEDEETGFDRDDEFLFAFRVKRLRFARKKVKAEDYSKGAFLAVGGGGGDGDGEEKEGDEPVLVDDVDGSEIENAVLVHDADAGGGEVYCVPSTQP
ncbi:hypothetical protein N3K66_000174 [Trichothecium roseum]|uniref:Uncharacterized protein n=1 Tax=Trichothecium roseum TaxID=47278 RepID=A0ACC0VCT4_9HYPO|nr:hypothetical protein N3K66_000174 [Trichothecium roseum]